jgi:putative hydrolase of the HAD superfamily
MKGIKLAISSSSNLAWVKGHLSRLNLLEYFDEICTCEDVNRVKPLPDLYLLALLKLGILPDEAIVFEDSPNGAIAANSAGIFCIVIPNPISRNLDISMADMIISNLEHFEMERFIIHRNFL